MANGAIPDSSITASSYQKHPHWNREPHYGRLQEDSRKFWGNTGNDTEPWIQVDLDSIHIVTGLQTEGNYADSTYQYWVKQIKVKIGMDERYLTFIEDDLGQPKVTKVQLCFYKIYASHIQARHITHLKDSENRCTPPRFSINLVGYSAM